MFIIEQGGVIPFIIIIIRKVGILVSWYLTGLISQTKKFKYYSLCFLFIKLFSYVFVSLHAEWIQNLSWKYWHQAEIHTGWDTKPS